MARSLKGIALLVALGTLLSKLGGMVRQLVIAAAFGIGAAYDAYNYAYVLPGFLLILLGGLNGPFHSAMASVLSKRPKNERSYILTSLNTIITTFLIIITGILIFSADQIITILSPRLTPEIHTIAVIQLQIMAPIAFLSGLIGLGFGSLNASEEFWIPSIAPLMTSLCIVIGIGLIWIQLGDQISSAEFALKGGISIAIATLIGALLQLLIQLPGLIKNKLVRVKLVWDFKHPGVKEVLKVMWPASLSSGMLQINVFTDLFFASGISGAASGLSYANLLIQTPLGLIANSLLVPLLPELSRLTENSDRPKLIRRIRQGLMFSTVSMVALGTLFIILSRSFVTLIYQRGAFDSSAVALVSGLLIAYGLGMPLYLCRDFLVRVFYALGDGITPFRLSSAGIGLNIVFDWVLIGGPSPWGNQMPFNFGAPGLVLATVVVNFFTCIGLITKLHFKIDELPLKIWLLDITKIILSGFLAGFLAAYFENSIEWSQGYLGVISKICITSTFFLVTYSIISINFGIKEVNDLWLFTKRKVIR